MHRPRRSETLYVPFNDGFRFGIGPAALVPLQPTYDFRAAEIRGIATRRRRRRALPARRAEAAVQIIARLRGTSRQLAVVQTPGLVFGPRQNRGETKKSRNDRGNDDNVFDRHGALPSCSQPCWADQPSGSLIQINSGIREIPYIVDLGREFEVQK